MADDLKCDWRTGCTNARARLLWYFCLDCGKRIPDTELVRCDFHTPGFREAFGAKHCDCLPWYTIDASIYSEMFDSWSADSMNDFLEAGS